MLDLYFLGKCLAGEFDFDESKLVSFNDLNHYNTRNRSYGPIMNTYLCKTQRSANLYFNRVPKLWNLLPVNVRICSTYLQYKNAVKRFYNEKFDNVFKTDDLCSWVSFCVCGNCRQ